MAVVCGCSLDKVGGADLEKDVERLEVELVREDLDDALHEVLLRDGVVALDHLLHHTGEDALGGGRGGGRKGGGRREEGREGREGGREEGEGEGPRAMLRLQPRIHVHTK